MVIHYYWLSFNLDFFFKNAPYTPCKAVIYIQSIVITEPFVEENPPVTGGFASQRVNKQRVLMHGHQGWNVRHGLCHICMRYIYIWVVYSLCFFCCLFITVTWWYVWCFEWASGNQEEVQACLVTLWLFIISCYSLYKTTLGLLCSWFENNPHFHKYSMDLHV